MADAPGAADFHFVLFVRPGDEDLFGGLPENFSITAETSRPYSVAELTAFPRRIRAAHIDLFHAMHYVLPFGLRMPAVVTIHDLIHLEFPFDGDTLLRYPAARLLMTRSLSRGRIIITATDSARRSLEELSPRHAAKLRTVPHGIAAPFHPRIGSAEIARTLSAHGIEGDYALFVGGARPQNLTRPRSVHAGAIPDFSLVLAGRCRRMSTSRRSTRGAMDRRGGRPISRRCIAPRCTVYPARGGFGLPVAEAMACGTPVITSDIPVFGEVAGDAALLVDPRDTDAIARAMRELHSNASLRALLSARGIARARAFSWDAAAARTLEIYREALA
jgi:glycosyltransferase involved in cell wall biosynthesis